MGYEDRNLNQNLGVVGKWSRLINMDSFRIQTQRGMQTPLSNRMTKLNHELGRA